MLVMPIVMMVMLWQHSIAVGKNWSGCGENRSGGGGECSGGDGNDATSDCSNYSDGEYVVVSVVGCV